MSFFDQSTWATRANLEFDHSKQSVSVRETVGIHHSNATLPPDRVIWHPIPQLHKGLPPLLYTRTVVAGCGTGCQETRSEGRGRISMMYNNILPHRNGLFGVVDFQLSRVAHGLDSALVEKKT